MAAHPPLLSDIPLYDKDQPPEPGKDHTQGGLFLVDKPAGWSSFDVVKFLRGRIGTRKTGHAGTLDPQATGLLVLCAGRATKSISGIQEMPKCYHAVVQFGASTPSQDGTTAPDEQALFEHITRNMIEEMIRLRFTGTIRQIPPMYSALWKGGKRLYSYARKGQVVERKPREVTIHEVQILSYEQGVLEMVVRVSKGTYIRTFAHDLGIALESRAYLHDLRRTEIGPYDVANAMTIEQLRQVFS